MIEVKEIGSSNLYLGGYDGEKVMDYGAAEAELSTYDYYAVNDTMSYYWNI
jgi:hypothetical protein